MTKPRILLVAGHANIRNLTTERLSGRDVAKLRRITGSAGEVEWTSTWCGWQRDALNATGLVEARIQDATYSRDSYAVWKPDLVIHGHLHRDPGLRALFSAPATDYYRGPFHSAAANAESRRLVERIAAGYTAALDIPTTPTNEGIPVTQASISVGMKYLYAYDFLEPGSQAMIAEFGNLNVEADRVVLYEPQIARIIRFFRDSVLEHFGLVAAVAAPVPARRAGDGATPPLPAPDLVLPGPGRYVIEVRG